MTNSVDITERQQVLYSMAESFEGRPALQIYGIVSACKDDASLIPSAADMVEISEKQLQEMVENYKHSHANDADTLAEEYQNVWKQKLVPILPQEPLNTLRQIAEGQARYPADFRYENSLQQDLDFLERCGLVRCEEVRKGVRSYTLWLN